MYKRNTSSHSDMVDWNHLIGDCFLQILINAVLEVDTAALMKKQFCFLFIDPYATLLLVILRYLCLMTKSQMEIRQIWKIRYQIVRTLKTYQGCLAE